jgi:hypothetical protein
MGIFSALFGADFAPAKCKTSLRLCLGRVKLLKNKKRVALQALRREIAELMRAGKYDSARVRVEGVLREEAMLEAFEVLDLFCELLVVRLPLISSTADLPADLREAVATVVYASRRASELPELAQIRAQFAAKYGKAFVAACAEDATAAACGVSPIALEKLSAAAPADQAASSRLRAVAEEHGVAFDEEAAHRAARNPIPHGYVPNPIDWTSTDTRTPERSIATAGKKDAPRPREYADASEAAEAARRAAAEARVAADAAAALAGPNASASGVAEEGTRGVITSDAPLPPPGYLTSAFRVPGPGGARSGSGRGRSVSEIVTDGAENAKSNEDGGDANEDGGDANEDGGGVADGVADLASGGGEVDESGRDGAPAVDYSKPSPPPGIAAAAKEGGEANADADADADEDEDEDEDEGGKDLDDLASRFEALKRGDDE